MVTEISTEVEWTCAACGTDGEGYHTLKCLEAKKLRGSWCTPEWLAKLIGLVDVDPCSNERSHIQAESWCIRDLGDDGLTYVTGMRPAFRCAGRFEEVTRDISAFINPPYDHGSVLKWVEHWIDSGFIFLLRWDPSTEWYRRLIKRTSHVWFADRRIDFEPPPHIRSSSNPYPHALYMHRPSQALMDRLAPHGYTFTG